ncbi:MAG: WG repeat-containing protein, partial [Lachnospiraceae bacterium]|nr:WG repeat-containing protein [Lachnospiraceae bacterium]
RIIKSVDLSAVSIENYDIPELAYLKAFDNLDVNVSWAVTPSIYADEILVSTRNYDMGLDDAAYIYTDGKWGFIDYNGEYIVEPKYSRTESYLELYTLRNDSESISLGCDENGNLIVNDYGMEPGYGGLSTEYFYFENMKTTIQTLDGMGGEVYKDERPVSVQKGNILDDSNITAESELYGMAGNRGLLVDIAYDGVYMFSGNNFNYFMYDSVTPGYAAFEKDGKWAFFNIDGSQMTDFSYDGFAQDKVISMAEVFWGGYDSSKPYLPTEGYIAVKSDGKCGYIDTDGEVVIPLGTFDDVRPVHNGKAWVKFGDCWGVIQLPKRTDELILPEKEDYIEYNELYDVINAYDEYFKDNYSSNTSYKFIYINDDDIPELFIGSGMFCSILAYINGEIKVITPDVSAPIGGFYLKPNEGTFVLRVMAQVDIDYKYSFDGSNVTEIAKVSPSTSPDDEGMGVYYFTGNGQNYAISESEYNDFISGYENVNVEYSSLIEAWVNAGR